MATLEKLQTVLENIKKINEVIKMLEKSGGRSYAVTMHLGDLRRYKSDLTAQYLQIASEKEILTFWQNN